MKSDQLLLAIVAFEGRATPSQIFKILQLDGKPGLRRKFDELNEESQKRVREKAEELSVKNVGVLFWGDEDYPKRLERWAATMPILFYWGNPALFEMPGIGMCGSRAASELGLRAAQACGEEVCVQKLVVVSGYAKGVDTETHLAALRNGGKTVIVLAEGFEHFRIKQSFPRALFKRENVLVVSQFSPHQPWTAGGAMTRNKIIYGLSLGLVVIEAGEKGGTLAAGQGALGSGRPVYVLDFNGSTPPGNKILVSKGGIPVSTRTQLGNELRDLVAVKHSRYEQIDLLNATAS